MKFKEATVKVHELTKKPGNETLLRLYALYKQATSGNCDKSEPGYLMVKGKEWYKWDAWNKLKGKSKDYAEKEYVRLVELLLKKDKETK